MLKTGDYDPWSMRMEQYLTHTDYALWEVIVNGDAPAAIALVSGSVKAVVPPKTTTEKIERRNELKAKSTLLLAIPDEQLLKFHGIKDAKTLWEEIKTRFGGNKESKKMQKTILKQQYENFVASRSKDLEQIDIDDLKEMDLKWQTKVECYNCHRRGHFARECRAPRSQGTRNRDNTRRVVPVETLANALVVIDGMGYDWSYQDKEGPTDFALLPFSSLGSSSLDTEVRDISITKLKIKLEESLKEKDNLKLKLEKFETSYRNLTNLLNIQLSSKDKTGLGYDSLLNERDFYNKSDVFKSASDSSVNESEEDNNQVNDSYKAGEGYHAVPPLYTGNFMPSRPDLSFAGNFVPTVVITNSEKVPINVAKQSSPRVATSTSTARYVNTAANRPTMNGTKPSSNVFHKSHSPVRRTFNQRTAPKNSDLKETVNTVKVNNVTTAGTKAVVSDVQGNGENVVKSTTC
nr:ribonuclease H-like domain-containing protein [Tanacetum cinerariifolium]